MKSMSQQFRLGYYLRFLDKKDFQILSGVGILQVLLSLLDLIGIGLMGVIGALTVRNIQSLQPGDRVSNILNLFSIENLSIQEQVAVLGISAAACLISRTLISIYVTKKSLFYLGKRSAEFSSLYIEKFLSQSLTQIQQKSMQDTLYSLTTGVNIIFLGTIGAILILVSDFSLLLILFMGLAYIDLVIAFCTVILFAGVGVTLYVLTHRKANLLGLKESELSIEGNKMILEVLTTYKEIRVRNRQTFYIKTISESRMKLANTLAELTFMPNIGKYVIETSLTVGILIISGLQFLLQDASNAVATLSVFMAAGTRIAPAVLRIQQGLIQIRRNSGAAETTLQLIEKLDQVEFNQSTFPSFDSEHVGFEPYVEIRDVRFRYPGAENTAISQASLTAKAGEHIAIVGPSGAGKTTLVDILLGLIQPDSGDVMISGYPVELTKKRWPNAIAYVPQQIEIIDGTIQQNITLGFPAMEIHEISVREALKVAHLLEFVENLPKTFQEYVGENGTRLSGGQRQRLGIARALITKPRLLVMDEATSSLDGETERLVNNAIQNLKGHVTVFTIAHRLSTVRSADQVVYVDKGKIRATGTFEEVRKAIPDFDSQASLMGL